MSAGLEPGIVVVDKPPGMTSHDVVGRCRRIFSTRKVGHAGTLDPMATGVLVIGIERATKILGLLTGASKSYAATIRLGQTTSTEDAEGELLQSVSAAHVTTEAVAEAMARLRGDIRQVPSAVSAIKVDGRRAYQLVREGPRGRTASAAGAHRPVRAAGRAITRAARRPRRRSRLLVGNLHPRAGPRSRRCAGRRRASDVAATHPGRALRTGPGVCARRAGRAPAADADASTKPAC